MPADLGQERLSRQRQLAAVASTPCPTGRS
jgi:hypothetical protein